MYCPNCNSPIDESEFFCGNCGINLKPKPINQKSIVINGFVEKSLPEYARLKKVPRVSISVYISYISFFAGAIIGLFISPLYGMLAGFIGIVSSSFISHKYHIVHKSLGFVLASMLVIFSIATISYNYSILKRNQVSNKISTGAVLISSTVNTSCFSFKFPIQLYLSANSSGCSLEAYNGSTLASSTVFYKVLSIQNQNINSGNFYNLIEPILLQDVKQNLPGFSIANEKTTTFANDLAFGITANSNTSNNSVIEEGVYHPSSSADFFDIIYSNTYPNVDLSNLQKSWTWKKY